MSLGPEYLDYPKRRRGMDHDHYDWSNLFAREPVTWPGGAKIAVWPVISAEYFPLIPADEPFRAPGHMQTAYPDYRHYTARDYGSRVGIFRLLGAFEAVGAKVSVAMNSVLAERYLALLDSVLEGGHEVIAHATDMNATIATGLAEKDERHIIETSLETLRRLTGTRPRGWLSIARSQSFRTPQLLVEAGCDYMCDWVNDELPYRFRTKTGEIVNIPLNHELSDRWILNTQQQSVDSYAEQMKDAHGWLASEAEIHGGRMLPMHLTPYIMGLPYRIAAFEDLVRWLSEQPDTWIATGTGMLEAWAS